MRQCRGDDTTTLKFFLALKTQKKARRFFTSAKKKMKIDKQFFQKRNLKTAVGKLKFIISYSHCFIVFYYSCVNAAMDITWKHRETSCQIKQNWTHMKKYRMKISFQAILCDEDEEKKYSRGNALEFRSHITLFIMFIIRQANDCLARALIFLLLRAKLCDGIFLSFFFRKDIFLNFVYNFYFQKNF